MNFNESSNKHLRYVKFQLMPFSMFSSQKSLNRIENLQKELHNFYVITMSPHMNNY